MTAIDQITVRVAFGQDAHTVSPTWTTVTGVRTVTASSSIRQRLADAFYPGSAIVVVDTSDRTFDPTYSGSPHAGDFLWGCPIEIYDDLGQYLFRGYCQRFTPTPGTHDSQMTIQALDGIGLLSTWTLALLDESAAAGTGDDADARIGRVLDAANWPAGDRDLDSDGTEMEATVYGNSALGELVKVQQSVAGLVYHSAHDGNVHFENRHAIQTRSRMASSQATFGTGGYSILEGTLRVSGIGDGFRNKVRITDQAGGVNEAGTVAATQAERAIDRDSIAVPPTPDIAQYLLDLYGTETPAVESWTVAAAIGDGPVDQAAASVRLRDRVTVAYDPAGTGTESDSVIVNSIRHDVTASSWQVSFTAEPAAPFDGLTGANEWLILDSGTQGQLDTDKLGY